MTVSEMLERVGNTGEVVIYKSHPHADKMIGYVKDIDQHETLGYSVEGNKISFYSY